jgi:hypothetical protein
VTCVVAHLRPVQIADEEHRLDEARRAEVAAPVDRAQHAAPIDDREGDPAQALVLVADGRLVREPPGAMLLGEVRTRGSRRIGREHGEHDGE